MVNCSACGKPIEKVPDWMQGITVEFICTNCPNRHTKNIAFAELQKEIPKVAQSVDVEEKIDVEEVATGEVGAKA